MDNKQIQMLNRAIEYISFMESFSSDSNSQMYKGAVIAASFIFDINPHQVEDIIRDYADENNEW